MKGRRNDFLDLVFHLELGGDFGLLEPMRVAAQQESVRYTTPPQVIKGALLYYANKYSVRAATLVINDLPSTQLASPVYIQSLTIEEGSYLLDSGNLQIQFTLASNAIKFYVNYSNRRGRGGYVFTQERERRDEISFDPNPPYGIILENYRLPRVSSVLTVEKLTTRMDELIEQSTSWF